jgi:hypothetical protein
MGTAVMMERIAVVFYLLTRISKQQKSNLMFRRTHGTPYWC